MRVSGHRTRILQARQRVELLIVITEANRPVLNGDYDSGIRPFACCEFISLCSELLFDFILYDRTSIWTLSIGYGACGPSPLLKVETVIRDTYRSQTSVAYTRMRLKHVAEARTHLCKLDV